MFKSLLKAIFPDKCVFCGTILNNEIACKNCLKNIQYMWKDDSIKQVKGKSFDYLFSAFKYSGIIRYLILRFKFDNQKYLYRFLSSKLIEIISQSKIQIDLISYVPISFNRFWERGYNQSFLIAKEVSQNSNIPIIKYGLVKIKHNQRQSELSYLQRINNIKDVYKVSNKNIFKGKSVLLIDDIYTTGNTVNECSKMLKFAGASQVIVMTIARK